MPKLTLARFYGRIPTPPRLGLVGLALSLAFLTLTACGPRFVELHSAADPAQKDSFRVRLKVTASAGASLLPHSGGAVGSARYDLYSNARTYLFEQDLDTGVTGGRMAALPLNDPAATGPETTEIASLAPGAAWRSLRVYDLGTCSGFYSWSDLASELTAFADNYVQNNPQLRGNRVRLGPVTLQPTLRAAGTQTPRIEQADSVRFAATYHADGVAGACNDVTIAIAATIQLGRRLGTVIRPARTAPPPWAIGEYTPSCRTAFGGSTLWRGTGDEWDFPAQVSEVIVDVSGPCVVELGEPGFRDVLARSIEATVRDTLRAKLQLPPGFLAGTDRRACTCDEECNPDSVQGPWIAPGYRHVCIVSDSSPLFPAGSCAVQLEADRVLFRPEGLEVVIAEDTSDFQDAFFDRPLLGGFTVRAQLCGPAGALRGPTPPNLPAGTSTVTTLAWPIAVP